MGNEMKTIDLKNILGETLFSYTCSENSQRRMLEEAIKHGIWFENVNLSDFDLSDLAIENITFEGCIFPKEFKCTTFRNCTIRDCSSAESHLDRVTFNRMTDERLEKTLGIKKDIKEAEGLLISLERYLAEPDIVFCKIGKRGQSADLQVCCKEVAKLVKRLRRNQEKLITSLKKQY